MDGSKVGTVLTVGASDNEQAELIEAKGPEFTLILTHKQAVAPAPNLGLRVALVWEGSAKTGLVEPTLDLLQS